MEKKYVPDGVCLMCNKGTLPSIFSVNPLTTADIYGMRLGNEFDKIPLINIKPMGICSITKLPCVPVPILWNPVKNDAYFSSGRLLQEDSKLTCLVGGQIEIMYIVPPNTPMPGDEGTGFLDQVEQVLGQLGPLGQDLQFKMGVAEGVFNGGKSMVEGLWSLGTMAVHAKQRLDEAVWDAVTHPQETAQGAYNAASGAYDWASDGQNWRNVGTKISDTAEGAYNWASDGQNWRNAGNAAVNTVSGWGSRAYNWAQNASPRQWGQLTGRVGFEVAAVVGTGGAGAGVKGAATVGRVAEGVELATDAARLARVGELTTDVARGTEALTEGVNAAGQVRRMGPVVDGAAARGTAEEAVGQAARKGDDLAGHAGREQATTRGHPIDVATGLLFTDHIDIQLAGPIPFVWDRIWYSRSRHRGPLGHGWHHAYDLSLRLLDEGVAALRMADGRLTTFAPPMIDGEPVFDRANQLTLYRSEGDFAKAGQAASGAVWRVWNSRDQYWYVFAEPKPGGSEQPLQAIDNAFGQSIQFSYAPSGQLLSITDSASRRLNVETDLAGRILAIHGPDPVRAGEQVRLVSYGYDQAGNLTTATDAEGHQQRYEYENHLLVKETNPLGLTFYFVYDGTGHTARCVHSWGDGGIYDTRFQYETPTTTRVWDSYGQEVIYRHWSGRVTDKIDASRSIWQWQYSPFGELLEERNPLGHTNRYTYDSRGNQTSATYADGGTVVRLFDAADRLLQYTDPAGSSWQYVYDEQGLLVEQVDPLGVPTRFVYDGWGRLTQQTNAMGQATYLRYDEQHQLTHLIGPDNSIRSRSYDYLGRIVSMTDAAGNQQRRAYDLLNQVIQLTEADGQQQTMAYDGAGNLTQVQARGQSASFTYTGQNRMASRQQAGVSVAFGYDKEGRLTSVRNEQGRVYQFDLDAEGRAIAETGFDGLTRRYMRDAAGRVVQLQRANDQTIAYQYDAGGRLTGVQYSDGTQASYAYDKAGRLLQATTGRGESRSQLSFVRDAMGQVIREQQDGHTLTHTYNPLGQRTQLTSSLGADVAFTHNQSGQVTQVSTQAGWQASFGYDQRGLEIQRQFSNGLAMEWEHDALSRPLQQRIGRAGHEARRRRYTWTGDDQLTRLDDSQAGPTAYQYNAMGFLTGARYADGNEDIRLADAVGNLYQSQRGQDTRYGPAGQLLQAGQVRYQYDTAGNLIRKQTPGGVWTYSWDGAGQLVQVQRPDGYAVQFAYDALGRRISKQFRGRITRWVWDGDKPLHEWHQYTVGDGPTSPDDLITWLFEADSFAPLAKLTAQGNYSVVADHLGTPIALYNESGKPTWEAQLDTYGRVRRGMGRAQDCPFRFQGQYEDLETGLYYNRFRYYAPQEGMYISQDPIGLSGSLAVYSYVSDTLSWVDPFGLDPMPGLIRYKPDRVTPEPGGRATAIDRAWRQEQALINTTGTGTRTWTQAELDLIRSTPSGNLTSVMSRAGYTGHHINSVNGNGVLGEAWQGDPRNIVFLENGRHPGGANMHLTGPEGHRGAFTNSGRGRLIDRQAMIDQYNRTHVQAPSCQ